MDTALVRLPGAWRKLSLPVRAVGRATTGRTPAGQDEAAEDSIICTDVMNPLLSCSGIMYDHDIPFFYQSSFFVLDRAPL